MLDIQSLNIFLLRLSLNFTTLSVHSFFLKLHWLGNLFAKHIRILVKIALNILYNRAGTFAMTGKQPGIC